jgi:hypothetical protein
MNRRCFGILSSFPFLTALLLLLTNDLLLKNHFHNEITGKLSDFSGLLVFVVFFIALLPKNKKTVILASALLFILWKSPASEGFIQWWNGLSPLTIHRTVDFSDLFALLVLPIAWYISEREFKLVPNRFAISVIGIITVFSFAATSYTKSFQYDRRYDFAYSEQELLNRLNLIKNDCKNNIPLSLDITHADTMIVDWNKDTSFYSLKGIYRHPDTIFKYDPVRKCSTKEIDTILMITVLDKDTQFLKSDTGRFRWSIPVKKYVAPDDGYCECVEAKLKITGNAKTSSLFLVNIYTSNCLGMFKRRILNTEKERLVNAFEEEVIKKLR